MKYALIVIALLAAAAIGHFVFISNDWMSRDDVPLEEVAPDFTEPEQEEEIETDENDEVEPVVQEPQSQSVLGTSAGGHTIDAYHFGVGDTELLFIGGIHGGYSWNTSLVAYELIDHLSENVDALPENIRITVVPMLNPDGIDRVVGDVGRFSASDIPQGADTVPGRFNANNVDLNRNFDCQWQPEGTWQTRSVSGGSVPFSEPESVAIRNYVNQHNPAAAVVWYSAAGGVFASNCGDGVLPETTELTNLFAQASGYRAYNEFDFYEITGDMVNWMAREGIPAISVLLTDHRAVEWDKNRAGIEAMIERYGVR